MKNSFPIIVIVSYTLFITLIYLVFGYYGYPPTDTDALNFLPFAINYELGKGLVNPVSEVHRMLDPSGQGKMIGYPPFFPIFLSWFMYEATPQAVFVAIAIINSVSLCLSAFCFYKIATLSQPTLTWKETVIILIAISSLATLFTGHYLGRPEVVVTFLFTLGITSLFLLPATYVPWAIGILLGFTGATSARGGIIFAIFIVGYYAVVENGKSYLNKLVIVASVSLFVVLTIFYLNAGIVDTFMATILHARFTEEFATNSLIDIIKAYLLPKNKTFYGIVFLLAVISAVYLFVKQRQRIAHPYWLYGVAVVFCVALYSSSLRIPYWNYNIFAFSPLFFLIIVYILTNVLKSFPTKLAILGLTMLSMTGWLYHLFTFPVYLSCGVTLEEARTHFGKDVLLAQSGRIGITGALWVLSENYEKMYPWEQVDKQALRKAENQQSFILLQQNYSAVYTQQNRLQAPQQINDDNLLIHHYLVADRFNPTPASFLGINFASVIPGYAYAIYSPKAAEKVLSKPEKKQGCFL